MNSRDVIERLVEGYKERPLNKIDDFMSIFSDHEMTQMIGIGATEPGKYEWFTGKEAIKEIVVSDWTYWGKVHFKMETLRLLEHGQAASFSLCAELEQVEMTEETWGFFLSQMKELLDKKEMTAADRMFEASHYGIRRVREKNLGVGHAFDMVVTGHLIKEDSWKIQMLHWSMPVE
ncbi:hypothetical protein EZV73_15275 [Acidaminobacter sp. JC074]|uniref:nuclear transport factor 2 family protein n=1 Tax=Acidaminobacter sp. JC074 TaxID=2530199 RepID=UPI001F0E35F1|nr:nuclear transport factor 2 family protein [Acidaminobacter sp. JC074]MCH4888954.1 hypothetical protein [Acidaminobacter sp. JC074]